MKLKEKPTRIKLTLRRTQKQHAIKIKTQEKTPHGH